MRLGKEGSVKISLEIIRVEDFRFGSVFIKKNQIKLKKIETGSN
jgi:hypothetical protein